MWPEHTLYVLLPFACVGAVGVIDVLAMRGQLGVIFAKLLPWNK